MIASLHMHRLRYPRAALQAAIVVMLMSRIAAAATNLITNGSFETPLVPAGKFTNFPSGSTDIPAWNVAGLEASIVDSKFTSFLIQFSARDGAQWLDLTGFLASTGESVKQTVATVVGQKYQLSFAVGNVFDRYGIYGTTSTVAVTVNGVLLGTFTNSCTTCTTRLTWQNFTVPFVAGSATTVIEFLNKDPVTDNCNGLDEVVLTEVSAWAS